MLLEHWPQKRREWVIGGFLNILFILCIVGIRYYYAQEEMEFLREDSVSTRCNDYRITRFC